MEFYEIYHALFNVATVVVCIMIAAIATVAIIVWFIEQLNKFAAAKPNKSVDVEAERVNGCTSSAADALMNIIYMERSENADLREKLDRKDEKIEKMKSQSKKWEAAKNRRISALENQLRENGIDPIPWEKNAA